MKEEAKSYWLSITRNPSFIVDYDRLIRITEEAILDKLIPDLESLLRSAYVKGLERAIGLFSKGYSEAIEAGCCADSAKDCGYEEIEEEIKREAKK